ncbi:hypothetical protein QUC32_16035 [Novosphingobium resinovorum]|uniref:hypothetical protein n=1 Tax=Novosphingobium TaxID=165696 RepID=UPI0012E9C4C5|nr:MULTISPECIES: hypothetical protein [Novosphingobium]MBF7011174.1 hypothetical protein [Novosphingobium sp. HR1a]WJM29161.1 hypothetical protein QUC32_16035 [Novosphingobium resinovorum]
MIRRAARITSARRRNSRTENRRRGDGRVVVLRAVREIRRSRVLLLLPCGETGIPDLRNDCSWTAFPGLAIVLHRNNALHLLSADISPIGTKITFVMSIISLPHWGLK